MSLKRDGARWVNKILFPGPPSSYDADTYPRRTVVGGWSRLHMIDTRPYDAETGGLSTLTTELPVLRYTPPGMSEELGPGEMIVMMHHANAADIGETNGIVIRMADRMRVRFALHEYPGFGMLRHLHPNETNVNAAARCAWMHLMNDVVDGDPHRIVVAGHSIGGTSATDVTHWATMTRNEIPRALFLIATLADLRVALTGLLNFPLSLVVKNRFHSARKVRAMARAGRLPSLLLVHGLNDTTLSWRNSTQLFEAMTLGDAERRQAVALGEGSSDDVYEPRGAVMRIVPGVSHASVGLLMAAAETLVESGLIQ